MVRRFGSLPIALACVAVLAACEGPTGPTGPAGELGPAGLAGPAGLDGNGTCAQCHAEDTGLFAKQVQYEASVHRNGGNFRRGSSASCSACHSHEGFTERIAAGTTAPVAGFENPTPPNCRTCHQIHTTFTNADFALATTAPVVMFNTALGTVDYGAAAGNLCAQCHQGRPLSPVPVIDGADVTPTSSRYGIHHGPQAEVVAGIGAFEFTGSATITGGPNTHGNVASNPKLCATCHMATPRGDEAGGHTWNMSWGVEGDEGNNTAGCETCHTGGLDSFDDHPFGGAGVQTEILGLLVDLETELVRIGIKRGMTPGYNLHDLEPYINENVAYPANVAAAFANWQMFAEDRSLGIHNPRYARAVLTNSIEVASTY